MADLDELVGLISGGSRVIVIAEAEVDLRSQGKPNSLVLLRMVEGSAAAGGRGGGFGERRVAAVDFFKGSNGVWSRLRGPITDSSAAEFEVPYYVSRLPMTLPDGAESVGYGAVDPDLVRQMLGKAGIGSSS